MRNHVQCGGDELVPTAAGCVVLEFVADDALRHEVNRNLNQVADSTGEHPVVCAKLVLHLAGSTGTVLTGRAKARFVLFDGGD